MSDYYYPARSYGCHDVVKIFEFECCSSCHEDDDLGYSGLCESCKKLSDGHYVEIIACCKCFSTLRGEE